MTKQIVAVLALSLISSSAFASQAKNLVTGSGDAGSILGAKGLNGSFYTNDEYNMFYNPAFINGMKSFAIIEHDNQTGTLNVDRADDQSAGFVTGVGAFNLGVFFNRDTDSVQNADRALDVVLGGDMGVKWGVGLTQSMSDGDASFMKLKAGVIVSDFEPFVHMTLKDTNGLSGAAEDKTSDMTVGTRYHYGDWTPYAAYRTTKQTDNGVAAADATNVYGLGLGRMAKMGDINMAYNVSYWKGTAGTAKTSVLPVEMTFSGDAASWLTLRGGFAHDVKTKNVAATTTASFGATGHFGKADLDTVIGGTDNGVGFADNQFVNVGLTYHL